MTYIILIAIYLISAVYNYFWIRRAHFHKNARWKYSKPNLSDFMLTTIPIVNTLFFIITLLFERSTIEGDRESWIVKFFKIGMK